MLKKEFVKLEDSGPVYRLQMPEGGIPWQKFLDLHFDDAYTIFWLIAYAEFMGISLNVLINMNEESFSKVLNSFWKNIEYFDSKEKI